MSERMKRLSDVDDYSIYVLIFIAAILALAMFIYIGPRVGKTHQELADECEKTGGTYKIVGTSPTTSGKVVIMTTIGGA